MGRFERGLANLERYADDDGRAAIAELRHLNAEHQAQQTPLQRYLNDKIQDHITELMVTGTTTVKPLGLDELLAMDGLR